MTNLNTNSSELDALFHPAAHYASPAEVLNDSELSAPEKRIILSSWASDVYAVESCPALREIPGAEIPLDGGLPARGRYPEPTIRVNDGTCAKPQSCA